MATLPDVRAIDSAILAVLSGDAILAALMPGGVYWDVAPAGQTKYLTVSRAELYRASYVFNDADGTEDIGYLVKAIAQTKTADPVLDAAARIHDLLHNATLIISDPGYELMFLRRLRPVRFHEYANTVQWVHAGGVYGVMVSTGPAN